MFISYRRETSRYVAALLRERLTARGFDVFLDVENLDNGRFAGVIQEEITTRDHLVVIIDPRTRLGAGADDWMVREVVLAVEAKRNVVPVLVDGARLDGVDLPTEIADLAEYNAITFSPDFLAASMDRLARFLGERPARPRPRPTALARALVMVPARAWRRRRVLTSVIAVVLVVAAVVGVVSWLRAPTVIPTTGSPDELALSPLGDHLYVTATALSSGERDSFSVVDTATETETGVVPLRAPPGDVAMSFDGRTAYVPVGVPTLTGFPGGSLAVIDTEGPRLRGEIPLPAGASGAVAASRDGTRVYVGLISGSVVAVDPRSEQVVAVSPPNPFVGREQRMVLTPDGGRLLLVTHGGAAALTSTGGFGDTAPAVWAMDTTTLRVDEMLRLGDRADGHQAGPTDVAMSADGRRAYVAEHYGRSVWLVDPASMTLSATIALTENFASTSAVAVGTGDQPLVASSRVDGPDVISFLGPRNVLGTVETEAWWPDALVQSSDGERIFVASYDGIHVVSMSGYTSA